MIHPTISKEFIGKFRISYKEDEIIYAFDDITYGLYKFSFRHREVSIVLFPESIYRPSSDKDKIMGISKRRDEIILIPHCLESEWVFYDVKNKTIRYDSLFKDKIYISNALTIGTNLFLIPANIYQPIILFSLEKMKIIRTYENWYPEDKSKTEDEKSIDIWGAAVHNNLVVFPVINSNYMCCMSLEEINIIAPDIPVPVFSVSVYKDKIWILPAAGTYIYSVNLKGKIIDKINLCQTGTKISVSRFIRIVATEEAVFLLPVYEKNIYVYQCKRKRLVQVEIEKQQLHGRLYEEGAIPYWNYIVENKTLHLLPYNYQYKRIDMLSLKSEEHHFCYGENIDYMKYWRMIGFSNKNCIAEKREIDLEDFFQYILCSSETCSVAENRNIGRQIWENVKLS